MKVPNDIIITKTKPLDLYQAYFAEKPGMMFDDGVTPFYCAGKTEEEAINNLMVEIEKRNVQSTL